MDVVYKVVCGLDVHFAMVMACLTKTGPKGGPQCTLREFATTLKGLKTLRDWLLSEGCEAVGMEATGVYWIPVYGMLEGHVQLIVGNPQHMQNLRGRKTDRKDAKWIADLVRHDLVRPSFVPKPEFRDARELSRYRRQLINDRSRVNNEIQRLLARAGVTIGTEISDVCCGVSGRAVLYALSEGRSVVDELPSLLHRSMHGKLASISAALEAPLTDIPRAVLTLQLKQLEEAEEKIEQVEKLLFKHLEPYNAQINQLMTIPGIKRISACAILAEIGVDMSAWPTEKHICAWAGVAPGCRETGGKQKRAPSRKGNPYLCTILMECAGAAVQKKGCYLKGKYHHLINQTGSKKKARMAIARKLVILIYRFLEGTATYKEPEQKAMSKKSRHKSIQKRVKDLEAMGFQVVLTPILQVS